MKVLIVSYHPNPDSFTSAMAKRAIACASKAGAEIRHQSLRSFDPVMPLAEHQTYSDPATNAQGCRAEIADLTWCDTLIFVFPTWWHGPPAALKGWLERVMVPGIAFRLPEPRETGIRPALVNVTRLAVLTTHGGTWLQTLAMGFPVRRMFMTALARLCHPRRKTLFATLYQMDQASAKERQRHMDKTAAKLDSLLYHAP